VTVSRNNAKWIQFLCCVGSRELLRTAPSCLIDKGVTQQLWSPQKGEKVKRLHAYAPLSVQLCYLHTQERAATAETPRSWGNTAAIK